MKRTLLVALTFVGLFTATPLVHAEATLWQTTNISSASPIYAGNSGTVAEKIAQRYVAPADQMLCTVYHQVMRVSSGIVNPKVLLTIREGGDNPESGVLIVTSAVSAGALPVQLGAEIKFELPSCVSMFAGRTYWFTFENQQTIYTISYGNYVSAFRTSNEFDYSSMWTKNGSAFVSGNVWVENKNGEWALRFAGPDPKLNEPIIIVPGILGTRLNQASDATEVWPNASAMVISPSDSYLNALTLDVAGNQSPSNLMNPSEVLDSVLTKNIFGGLIDSLIGAGYASGTDLFTVPYDWRLDLVSSVGRLDAVIQTAINKSPTGKVVIIAHSLGGVLVKEYLRQSGGAAVAKLILAGVPELGSPKAFKALTYGDNFGFKLGPLDILSPNRIKLISQNMPAVYQLLPSRSYINTVGRYIVDFTGGPGFQLDYAGSREFMTREAGNSRNPALLDRATDFHETLDAAPFNMPVDSIYRLSGCQNPATLGDVRVYAKNKFDLDSIDGDGTVPLRSALYSPVGHDYVALYSETGINHAGLVSDDRSIALLRHVATSTSTPPLPAGITADKTACGSPLPAASESMVVSTHSPVELHLYDEQGRHTGPVTSGDIESDIPGSTYEKVADNSFVLLPSGPKYRARVVASSTRSTDLKVKKLSGVKSKKLTSYLDVPLGTASATAELVLTSSDVPPELEVDTDGNGVIDIQLGPDLVLSDPSPHSLRGAIARELERKQIRGAAAESLTRELDKGSHDFLVLLKRYHDVCELSDRAYQLLTEEARWLVTL